MPNPISGNAQAQAATQVRIINLSPAIPSAITGEAVVAIDLPNETYKLTLDELVDFTDIANYLPLAGGVMTGDITLSNSLSLNTVSENADAGNIGKSASVTQQIQNLDAHVINGFTGYGVGAVGSPEPTREGLLITCVRAISNAVEISQTAYAGTNVMYYRTRINNVWGSWFQIATTQELSGYLPLTGGTLTADGENLILEPATDGSAYYIRFRNFDGTSQGFIGRGSGEDRLDFVADSGDILLQANLGFIRLNTNTRLGAEVQLLAPNSDDASFTFSGDNRAVLSGFPTSGYAVILRGNGAAGVDAECRVNTLGTFSSTSDIIAFEGLANQISMSGLDNQIDILNSSIDSGTTGALNDGAYPISFNKTFPSPPAVTASPLGDPNQSARHWITNITTTGFTLNVDADNVVAYNWIAVK